MISRDVEYLADRASLLKVAIREKQEELRMMEDELTKFLTFPNGSTTCHIFTKNTKVKARAKMIRKWDATKMEELRNDYPKVFDTLFSANYRVANRSLLSNIKDKELSRRVADATYYKKAKPVFSYETLS